MLVRCRVLFYFILIALLLLSEAGALTSYAADSPSGPEQDESGIRLLNVYAGFKNNHFHLKLGSHYDVLSGVGTPEKLYRYLKNQWQSNLRWFLLSKLLPPSTVPYPSFSRGVPSWSRAFGSSPDCNPHPVIMDHPMLGSRFSVKTSCLDNQPVWQITASPAASVPSSGSSFDSLFDSSFDSSFKSEPKSVQGRSLNIWLSLWKQLNDSNASHLFLRPWRDREENRLQAIICPAAPPSNNPGKQCQSVLIDFPLNHESPWLLPELAGKEAVSPHGQTALDSAHLALVSQAMACLTNSEGKQPSGKNGLYACANNRWLYRLSDNQWVFQTGIPECPVKPGPALLTGKYLNIRALETLSQKTEPQKKESPENEAQPTWARSSLLIARNDQHRKYHLWGAGNPVLVMQFPDKPYDIKERYFGWDRPEIGNLVEHQYLNLATFVLNTVSGTPFNVYQLHGALSGFRLPVGKSLGERVREQILQDPPSLYEFAKKRPELRDTIKNYLTTELPGHPVNAYFSEPANPELASQITPFAVSLSLNQATLLSGIINTPSDASGNYQPVLSEAPQSPSKPIKANNGYRREHINLKSKRGKDEGDKELPPSGSGQKLHDIPSSLTVWDHLAHLHKAYHLEYEAIESVSDFTQNIEYFRLNKRFDPTNPRHLQQVAAALGSSVQVIVPNGFEKYRNYASNPRGSRPPQPMGSIATNKIILLHGDKVVSLSYFTAGSRDFPWLPHFLDSSGLNEKETAWLESNRQKKIFWQIFPEWKQHVLLSRESLGCDSIASASDLLQQAFTEPSEFMKGEHWRSLFRVYNELGIVSYPFDLAEGGTQTEFLINKNMLGAVLDFWNGAAKRYVPVLFPELDASTIDSRITALKDYLTNFSTGALLVREQHFSYVVPTLLVLAPVVKKIHTTVMRELQTRRALVYGGAARRKHISSRMLPEDTGKTPLIGDIDLALESSVSLQDFRVTLEKQLQEALPGTLVRSLGLGLKVTSNQQVGVTTEKMIISLKDNRDIQKESWRVFSVDISSATAENHFDFSRVEPYLPDSELLVPNIFSLVKRLLHDLRTLKDYTGEDKERREANTHNALKMLLAYDSDQQVQIIIRNTFRREPDSFDELPAFLRPFTHSLRITEKQNLPTYRHSREGGNPPRTVDPRLRGDDDGRILNAATLREVQAGNEEALPAEQEPSLEEKDKGFIPVVAHEAEAEAEEVESTGLLPSSDNTDNGKKKKKRKKRKKAKPQSPTTLTTEETGVKTAEQEHESGQSPAVEIKESTDSERLTKEEGVQPFREESPPAPLQTLAASNEIIHAEATNGDAVPADNDDENLPAAENSESVKKKKKKKNGAQKKLPATIDIKTGEQKSEEISRWMESMEKRFLDALPLNKESESCKPMELDSLLPSTVAEFDVLERLEVGLLSTAQLLACSGSHVDTAGNHPVIALNLEDNLAQALSEEQRKALDKAALEYHFPYAKLLQALLLLNQKYPANDQKKLLQAYETAFGLLVPAALAGIPMAYHLLLGLQLHQHHPVGWPQLESVNRLLRHWSARETSPVSITMNGLQAEGLLEQLLQDNDVPHLMAIEQGIDKEPELSERGKKVYDILKALRKPEKERLNALKEVRPQHFPELLQSIGLLKLLTGKVQQAAVKQSNTELWSYSLNAMGAGGTSKKKSAQPRILPDAPQVLVMSDLAALKGMGSIAALFKGHQGNEIMFGHARLWEHYQGLSLKESSDQIQNRFIELFSEITAFPVDKARPGLIRDWVLARSFLSSRGIRQPPIALLEPEAQAPENEKPHKNEKKTVEKENPQQQQPGASRQQGDSVKQAASPLNNVAQDLHIYVKRGVRGGTRKNKKTVSNPPSQSIDEDLQLLNMINYLDISLVQVIKSIEHCAKCHNHYEDLAKKYTKLVNSKGKKLDAFLAGYNYFLTALALLNAKMSSDNKIIRLTISPAIYANPRKILNLILEAEHLGFPYALMLKDVFLYRVTGQYTGFMTGSFMSALAGVSQGAERFMRVCLLYSTLSGLILKWLVQLRNRFELKFSIDPDPESIKIEKIFPGLDQDTPMSLLLREFLEQIPAKGTDQALDQIINRIDKKFFLSSHLADLPSEKAALWAQAEEGSLKAALHVATGRKELTESGSRGLEPAQTVAQYIRSDLSQAEAESLSKQALGLERMEAKDIAKLAEMVELALYLTKARDSAPDLTSFHTLEHHERESLIGTIYGSDLQLLEKAGMWMVPDDWNHAMPVQYLTVLAHLYLTRQSGGHTKKIIQFLTAFKESKKQMGDLLIELESKMWIHWFVKKHITGQAIAPAGDDMPVVFNVDSLRDFAKGDDFVLIYALDHAKQQKYPQLISLLNQYESKFDPESLLMSGWLNCLAGLKLLRAQALSFDLVELTVSSRSALQKAHAHFDKARKAGFPYSAYLDALVLMRLNDCYQSKVDLTSKEIHLSEMSSWKPSARKKSELLFIKVENIVRDILPLLMESALLGVRPAADTVIRFFTDDNFNLLQIPQAGWPSKIVQWLLTAPQNHDIHFSFSEEGTETENILFSKKSNSDSISGILLAPIDDLRREQPIEQRLQTYDYELWRLINESDKPKSIKKYLRLIRAFMLGNGKVLDTDDAPPDTDIERLQLLLDAGLKRAEYEKKVQSIAPLIRLRSQPTDYDDYAFNLPFLKKVLKSADDYDFWQAALLIRQRSRSKLIHHYIWAYEILADLPDNESNSFWKDAIPEIDMIKNIFTALLATGDLTSMHSDERCNMQDTFSMYRYDINRWLGYLDMVEWLNAWSRGQEVKQGLLRARMEAFKISPDVRDQLLPLQLWHEHWSMPEHNEP